MLQEFPEEYRYIPINGETYITENNVSIRQDWSMYKNLDEIQDANGYFRELSNISGYKRTLTFELNEVEKTLTLLESTLEADWGRIVVGWQEVTEMERAIIFMED